MSRNIKEIGKELMGKSLNSFHRKTGLTQLEENNKMQDGILDGILSQVDDAYIEKTEQSNVIHLDGSGDGVVVVDSVEGNTLVNLWDNNRNWSIYSTSEIQGANANCPQSEMTKKLKANTNYTYVVMGASENINLTNAYLGSNFVKSGGIDVTTPVLVTTISDYNPSETVHPHLYPKSGSGLTESDIRNLKILFIEGDHRDKSLNWFEGLQSSFEEKVNEQGKYEIEILSDNGGNLLHGTTYTNGYFVSRGDGNLIVNNEFSYSDYIEINSIHKKMYAKSCNFNICFYDNNKSFLHGSKYGVGTDENYWVEIPKNAKYFRISVAIVTQKLANVSYQDVCNNVKPKQNKIKLLLDEPLRSAYNKQDRLFVNNGKLMVERWLQENIINGTEHWTKSDGMINSNTTDYANFCSSNAITNHYNEQKCLSDKFMWEHSFNLKEHNWINNSGYNVCILKSKANTINEFKTWLSNNNIKVVSVLREPTYEEVLNEYGEPIILEGYENGTIYIDSTIVPTTTVRYTPKMESFKTLKEVNNNNIMLTNDVNDNIIPYMMDVDLMIMEKEMALMSQCKIRKAGAKDMTSMQKRTQDMLTRLIKGKTLTEQECKTRVVTYLDAGKITDAQADELMLLISEVYA